MTKEYIIRYKVEDRYWIETYYDSDSGFGCAWGKHPDDATSLKDLESAIATIKSIIEIEKKWYGARSADEFEIIKI